MEGSVHILISGTIPGFAWREVPFYMDCDWKHIDDMATLCGIFIWQAFLWKR
jgi:hypothetical protein